MKLITKEIEKKFKKYPLGSQDGKFGDAEVIVKFFSPIGGATWLITEGNKLENGDYEMFGYCNLGDNQNAEFGYVLLSQLEEIELPLGLKIERSLYLPKNYKLIDALKDNGITPPNYFYEKENTSNKYKLDLKIIQEQFRNGENAGLSEILNQMRDKKIDYTNQDYYDLDSLSNLYDFVYCCETTKNYNLGLEFNRVWDLYADSRDIILKKLGIIQVLNEKDIEEEKDLENSYE